MSLRVLVTGGAGYIGSVLSDRLLETGSQVTVVDSLIYRQNSLFHLCANPRFDFVYGDARDEHLMQGLIAQADVIIPLAALVGAPACDRDPSFAASVNLDAIRLIKRLRSPEQLVLYPTTNSGYGTKTGDIFCTEDTSLEPISLYGQTKSQAERELLESPNAIT